MFSLLTPFTLISPNIKATDRWCKWHWPLSQHSVLLEKLGSWHLYRRYFDTHRPMATTLPQNSWNSLSQLEQDPTKTVPELLEEHTSTRHPNSHDSNLSRCNHRTPLRVVFMPDGSELFWRPWGDQKCKVKSSYDEAAVLVHTLHHETQLKLKSNISLNYLVSVKTPFTEGSCILTNDFINGE